MKKYLSSVALLPLIAAVLSGCHSQEAASEKAAQQDVNEKPADSVISEWWPAHPAASNKPALVRNQVPSLQVVQFELDTASQTLHIGYDLQDAENDSCEVRIDFSSDSGRTYLGQLEIVAGRASAMEAPGRGKKVTCRYPVSFDPAKAIVRITANDRQVPDWQELAKQVNKQRLKQDVETFSMVRNFKTPEGVKNLSVIKDSLEKRWQRYGLQTGRQYYKWFGYDAHNMMGRLPGISNEAATIVVGGHFDTVKDCPGADDNATGIAAILEISRILSAYHPEKSVKFIGFDLEEEGLVGSKMFLDGKGLAPFEKPVEAIIIDMIGYTSEKENSQVFPAELQPVFPQVYEMVSADKFRGNFAVSIANESAGDLSSCFSNAAAIGGNGLRVGAMVVKGKGEQLQELRRGDHCSFWDVNINALYLGDGADTRNPDYHKPTDRPEQVNYDHLTKVTRAALVTVAQRAGMAHAAVKYLQPGVRTNALAAIVPAATAQQKEK